jgi:hypothetical protein
VEKTADPSASLGMTKGGATLPLKVLAGQKAFFITLGDFGAVSAQQPLSMEAPPSPLSSRLKRSAVEAPAVFICSAKNQLTWPGCDARFLLDG